MSLKMSNKRETTVKFRNPRFPEVEAVYPKSFADKQEQDLRDDGWYKVVEEEIQTPKTEKE